MGSQVGLTRAVFKKCGPRLEMSYLQTLFSKITYDITASMLKLFKVGESFVFLDTTKG